MEGIVVLALLFVFGLPLLCLFLVVRLGRRIDEAKLRALETELRIVTLEKEFRGLRESGVEPAKKTAERGEEPILKKAPVVERKTPAIQPGMPPEPDAEVPGIAGVRAPVSGRPISATPQSTPSEPDLELDIEPGVYSKSGINWEQFLGVKLFAWAAGLALFLGVAFFLKWSFDHGFVTPPVRVAMGLITGLALLIGGLRLPREQYAAIVQVLTAAAVLVLYADIFASYSFYHFIGQAAAFVLMALVTATAFLLATRLNSPTVAVLGLLGGFLTPPLLSTGVDRPLGLFTYIAFLDAGLLAVAQSKRWTYLALLSAIATVVMQFGWVAKFFAAEKALTAIAIFLFFSFLHLLALLYAHRKNTAEGFISASAILMPAAAMLFAFYVLAAHYPAITSRPWLLFGYVFVADVIWLLIGNLRRGLRPMIPAAGSVTFLLLAFWTIGFLASESLNWALGLYLIFALLHSALPFVLERLGLSEKPPWWTGLLPAVSLVLVMIPIFRISPVSILVWPAILLIDLLAILLAFLTASVLGILAVLSLTALATSFWIFHMPALLTGLPETLLIIVGFAILFFIVGTVLAKKNYVPVSPPPEGTSSRGPLSSFSLLQASQLQNINALIPGISALLPYLLLVMVTLRLPLADPSPLFGVAALMAVLLLVLVRYYQADWASAAGLAGVLLLESAWHFSKFNIENAAVALIWYLAFYTLFTLFPFLVRRNIVVDRAEPWAVAALAGPAQFYFVYRLIAIAFKTPYMGVVPAVFAVFSLIALIYLIKTIPTEAVKRNTQLALFGGTTLFFITLIFPVQFEKQWITIGWALEGAALLWLFHRVPHNGLRYTGAALLVAAFVRLALNPAVLAYHPREATPILNWYLYAYGIVTICLFIGMRMLSPPNNLIREVNAQPILAGLGTVLAFLLVNIEIADYFSSGVTITFQFSGNFGRDMTYSLAWGFFAFILLMAGIFRRVSWARYAGIALLVVTLTKLFLHDLWRLGGLYRIGSLVGLALVLLPVSFFYQRFLSADTQKRQGEMEQPG
ncbi:MAG: DUF2339 domain-containing protein [Thermodesulfobacteriota bacterium]